MKSTPSWLWYLVPLGFGIFGGIIGYYAIVDRNKEMAKMLLITGIIITVVSALISNIVVPILALIT